MWKEFKAFAIKGNIIDLAIAVIIGSAFSKIVTSLVNDIIMPVVLLLIGRVDFSSLTYYDIKYGAFIQTVVNFFIVAFSIFIVIRYVLRHKKKEEVKETTVDPQEELLREIRDLLKNERERT
ncbi:large conductance mechanosensitive channel protein MscL [Bacillus gobiensis]|uniref:large conductance mechanosensitive channel protein MscL n=1 Tax=Bacillus gobiensis TaxID=1441095 RepID=UPI003D220FC1